MQFSYVELPLTIHVADVKGTTFLDISFLSEFSDKLFLLAIK